MVPPRSGGRPRSPKSLTKVIRVLPADGDTPHGAFGGVVIDLQKTVIEIGPQALDARECIADGFGQGRFAGDPRELAAELLFKIVENRFGFELPQPHALFRRGAARFFLDGVERGNAHDRLFRDGGAPMGYGGMLDIDELSPHMRHAGDFADNRDRF